MAVAWVRECESEGLGGGNIEREREKERERERERERESYLIYCVNFNVLNFGLIGSLIP